MHVRQPALEHLHHDNAGKKGLVIATRVATERRNGLECYTQMYRIISTVPPLAIRPPDAEWVRGPKEKMGRDGKVRYSSIVLLEFQSTRRARKLLLPTSWHPKKTEICPQLSRRSLEAAALAHNKGDRHSHLDVAHLIWGEHSLFIAS